MTRMTRRTGLKLLAGGALATGIAPLATGPALAAGTSVTVALDWTPNTNHIGLYVAQAKGYFGEAGLAVTILPYTDTAAGTLISHGRADFGIVGAGFFAQKAAGADLRVVYAVVQSETGRLVVDAKRMTSAAPRISTAAPMGASAASGKRR